MTDFVREPDGTGPIEDGDVLDPAWPVPSAQSHTVNCGCGFDAETPNGGVIVELLEAHACPSTPRPQPERTAWHESLSNVLIAAVIAAGLAALINGWPAPWK